MIFFVLCGNWLLWSVVLNSEDLGGCWTNETSGL